MGLETKYEVINFIALIVYMLPTALFYVIWVDNKRMLKPLFSYCMIFIVTYMSWNKIVIFNSGHTIADGWIFYNLAIILIMISALKGYNIYMSPIYSNRTNDFYSLFKVGDCNKSSSKGQDVCPEGFYSRKISKFITFSIFFFVIIITYLSNQYKEDWDYNVNENLRHQVWSKDHALDSLKKEIQLKDSLLVNKNKVSRSLVQKLIRDTSKIKIVIDNE